MMVRTEDGRPRPSCRALLVKKDGRGRPSYESRIFSVTSPKWLTLVAVIVVGRWLVFGWGGGCWG